MSLNLLIKLYKIQSTKKIWNHPSHIITLFKPRFSPNLSWIIWNSYTKSMCAKPRVKLSICRRIMARGAIVTKTFVYFCRAIGKMSWFTKKTGNYVKSYPFLFQNMKTEKLQKYKTPCYDLKWYYLHLLLIPLAN